MFVIQFVVQKLCQKDSCNTKIRCTKKLLGDKVRVEKLSYRNSLYKRVVSKNRRTKIRIKKIHHPILYSLSLNQYICST